MNLRFSNALASGPPRTALGAQITKACRRSPHFVVTIADLIAFARSPYRWAYGEPDVPARGYNLTDLIRTIILEGTSARGPYVARPSHYQHVQYACPTCRRIGNMGKCAACNRQREKQTRAKAWTAAAKECQQWHARLEQTQRVAVAPADWARATGCYEAVRDDLDAATLLQCAKLNQWYTVDYYDLGTRLTIPVAARVDVIPNEGHNLDCAVGMICPVLDAGHSVDAIVTQTSYRHMHAALVRMVAGMITGREQREVLMVLVETQPPFQVARRRLAGELIDAGYKLLVETLQAFARCRKRRRWPTFDASAPSQLRGWTLVHRNPQIQESNDHTDARYAILAHKGLPPETATAQLGPPVPDHLGEVRGGKGPDLGDKANA